MQSRCWILALGLTGLLVLVSATWAVAVNQPETDSNPGTMEQDVEYGDPTVREGPYSMTEVYVIVGLAFAACFTMAISILGAGFAVGKIGASALGAAAEHPELLARSLLFVALAEGLAVLGFAVAMLIVMQMPG